MPDLFFDLGIDDFRFDRDALYVGCFFFSSKILSSKISNRDVRHKFFFCLYSGVAKRNWSESKDSIRAPDQNWRAFEAPAVGRVSRLEFLFGSDKVQSNRNSKSELPCNSLLARLLVSLSKRNCPFQ